MWCHVLFVLPILGLGLFTVLPFWTALPFYGLIVAASVLLIAPGIKALRAPVQTGREAMIGAEGRVVREITSEGLIQVRNELWRASSDEPIPVGERVIVIELQGLKAVVRRKGG